MLLDNKEYFEFDEDMQELDIDNEFLSVSCGCSTKVRKR